MIYTRVRDDSLVPVSTPHVELQNITATNILYNYSEIALTGSSGTRVQVSVPTNVLVQPGRVLVTFNKIKSITVDLSPSDTISINTIAQALASGIASTTSYTATSTADAEILITIPYPSVNSPGDPYRDVLPYNTSRNNIPVIEVSPKDDIRYSTNATEQTIIQDKVSLSQTGTPVAGQPHEWYHSALKHRFYSILSNAVASELQGIIYAGDQIRNFWNVDFFNGDETTYQETAKDILFQLGMVINLAYLKASNYENGDILSVEKQNSFIRGLIKSVGFIRKWAGSSTGYAFPFKIINRTGAVNLGILYPSSTSLTTLTGRSFRFLNTSKVASILPGSPTFPNSLNLDGITSIYDATAPYYTYDTGILYDDQIIATPNMYPGNINVVFGVFKNYPGLVSNKYYIEILSVAGANVGKFSFLGKSISVNASDISSTSAFIAKILSQSPFVNWSSHLGGPGSGASYDDAPVNSIVVEYTSYNTLTYDSKIPLNFSGKGIMLELALDRVLYHTNTLGTRESLMDIEFLETLSSLLPYLKRSQDTLFLGTQMSLVTSSDGRYNTLSGSDYTHPNILAKFQTFKYSPGFKQNAWSSMLNVSYVKLGNGGYKDSYVESNVLIPVGVEPNAIGKVVLSDVMSPLFRTYVGFNEKGSIGGYNYLSVMINPISIINTNRAETLLISCSNNTYNTCFPTYVDLVNRDISRGTISTGVNIAVDFNDPNRSNVQQRLFFYQEKEDFNNTYNPRYQYQELDSLGNYVAIISGALLDGYTTDADYAGYSMDYFPSSQKQTVILHSLNKKDQYWYLNTNQVLNLNMDVATNTSIQDMWAYQGMTPTISPNTVVVTNGTLNSPSGGITSNYMHIASGGSIVVTDGNHLFGNIPATGLTNFTFSCLIRPNGTNPASVLLDMNYWKMEYVTNGVSETYTVTKKVVSGINGVWTFTGEYGSEWKHIALTVKGELPLFIINGTLVAPDTEVVSVGSTDFDYTNPVIASSYVGDIAEICIYDTHMTLVELENLCSTAFTRKTLLRDTTNTPLTCWIDEPTGKIVTRMQYNPYGVKTHPIDTFPDGSYEGVSTQSVVTYKTGYSNTTVGVSEIGLFNSDDVMVAYGTFPPVIYNQSSNHISFNLFVKQ